MNDIRPIGVFDSGLGGLTVVRELMRIMPHERIVYLGDTARFPYGGHSDDVINTFGMQDAKYLMSMNIKMLIVACNTVSSVALNNIRKIVDGIPVIGVVMPGCKAAVLRSADKKIGVIGTNATIRAGAYTKGIHSFDTGIKVFGKPCPLFAPLVEEGLEKGEIAQLIAQHYLYELVDMGIDCLILGCTHYPLLMETILSTVSNRIELIDSAVWTAKEAKGILTALEYRATDTVDGMQESIFNVTDAVSEFVDKATHFIGRKVKNVNEISLDELIKYMR